MIVSESSLLPDEVIVIGQNLFAIGVAAAEQKKCVVASVSDEDGVLESAHLFEKLLLDNRCEFLVGGRSEAALQSDSLIEDSLTMARHSGCQQAVPRCEPWCLERFVAQRSRASWLTYLSIFRCSSGSTEDAGQPRYRRYVSGG